MYSKVSRIAVRKNVRALHISVGAHVSYVPFAF